MFFRRRETKDEFYEAVRKRNWRKVARLGRKRFEELGSKTPLEVIVTTASALSYLNRKDIAVSFLIESAREKNQKGLVDEAEFLLQKAYELKRTPEVVEELISFYLTRGNRDKIIEILSEILTDIEEGREEKLLTIVEENIQKVDEERLFARLAVFYEKKSKQKAYHYWIRAAETFERKGMDEYAFRALLRAKKVMNTEEINRRIVDYIAVKSGQFPVGVLIQILLENRDPHFWLWVFEEFRNKGKMEIFKGIIDNEEIDPTIKFFFTVLLLADLKGVYPSDILDEIYKRDEEIYTILIDYLEKKYGQTLLKTIFGDTQISIDEILAFEPSKEEIPSEMEYSKEATEEESGILGGKIEVNIDDLFG